MKSVECAEAQVVFALKLLKTEKDVMIFSFTDDRNKLKPVAWNAETTFGQAMKLYEAEIVSFLKRFLGNFMNNFFFF